MADIPIKAKAKDIEKVANMVDGVKVIANSTGGALGKNAQIGYNDEFFPNPAEYPGSGGAIGENAQATHGFAGGWNAKSEKDSVALGKDAKAPEEGSVQLGTGENNIPHSVQFERQQIIALQPDGSYKIPDELLGSGGTNDHNELINRDAPDQHTIGSITGLQAELDQGAQIYSGTELKGPFLTFGIAKPFALTMIIGETLPYPFDKIKVGDFYFNTNEKVVYRISAIKEKTTNRISLNYERTSIEQAVIDYVRQEINGLVSPLEEDMTQPIGRNAEGKLVTKAGGGVPAGFELIATQTIPDGVTDTRKIIFEGDFTPYSELFFVFGAGFTKNVATGINVILKNGNYGCWEQIKSVGTMIRNAVWYCHIEKMGINENRMILKSTYPDTFLHSPNETGSIINQGLSGANSALKQDFTCQPDNFGTKAIVQIYGDSTQFFIPKSKFYLYGRR